MCNTWQTWEILDQIEVQQSETDVGVNGSSVGN
jgi:hypothetical protein